MIRYSTRRWCMAALLTVALTVGLIAVDEWWLMQPYVLTLGLDAAPYLTFTMVLCFLVGFRTSQAYHRFWDGASAAYEVTGGLYMAASNHDGLFPSWDHILGGRAEVQTNRCSFD